jgi:hypothetical protein
VALVVARVEMAQVKLVLLEPLIKAIKAEIMLDLQIAIKCLVVVVEQEALVQMILAVIPALAALA